MTITIDLPDDTVWALMESTGEENLEDAVLFAIAGYLRLERSARRQELTSFPLQESDDADADGPEDA